MKILVTGSQGFIATNLIKQLVVCGHQIVGVDNMVSGSNNIIYTRHLCDHFNLDLSSSDCIPKLSSILDQVDTVIHLAANGNVVDSVSSPGENFNSNVVSTFNLLECIRNVGVKRIVFSSTGGALMGNTPPPVSEASVPMPISPYGSSKLSCEAYIRSFSHCYNFESIILRFGNVYGPFSSHKKGVINQWIRSILKNEPLVVYGDGNSSRDYIHVSDLCSGLINSLSYEFPLDSCCEVFHLSNSREITLNELADVLRSISTNPFVIQKFPVRVGEVANNFADTSKAKQLLRFMPSTSFDDGISELFEWIRQNEFSNHL